MVAIPGYRLLDRLGAGASGEVHLAIQESLQRHVAVKLLSPGLFDAQETRARFLREARLQGGLSHPNLVSLYELSYHEDLWFFTMDHIDGVDFVEWLRGAPVSTPETSTNTVVSSPKGARNARAAGAETNDHKDDAAPAMPPSMPRVRNALAQLIAGVHRVRADVDAVVRGTVVVTTIIEHGIASPKGADRERQVDAHVGRCDDREPISEAKGRRRGVACSEYPGRAK